MKTAPSWAWWKVFVFPSKLLEILCRFYTIKVISPGLMERQTNRSTFQCDWWTVSRGKERHGKQYSLFIFFLPSRQLIIDFSWFRFLRDALFCFVGNTELSTSAIFCNYFLINWELFEIKLPPTWSSFAGNRNLCVKLFITGLERHNSRALCNSSTLFHLTAIIWLA